ncbi:protein indeterminate-domain 12-like [Impatiens glandulifera]|uniref:protein indeterminate-domain 12-like n=1 Tax=Impatiens glandulifera TaxID=253017 RepID=UPI001FB0D61E|nr:protein indeterminate-domain 12-like [Impatiens glandulifera]
MSSQEEEQKKPLEEEEDFDDSNSTTTAPASSASNNNGSFTNTNTLLHLLQQQQQQPSTARKKRNLPGNPDPNSEVITLSPKTLVATNRFVCEICSKGFQRDQNLQLHRRGHNLPWKLKQRLVGEEAPKRRVYVCPEPSCVHHHPSRALGDLTGIKKHFSRKHGEKKWKCDKCPKKYAVQSDWKAHSKICGTKEYKCDCGTIFSRRDSFITHRAFCDALAEENKKPFIPTASSSSSTINNNMITIPDRINNDINATEMYTMDKINSSRSSQLTQEHHISMNLFGSPRMVISPNSSSSSIAAASSSTSPHLSATALLQKAAQIGVAAASRDIVILSHNSLMPTGLSVTTMAGSSFAPPYDQIQSQTANYAPSQQPSDMTNNESLILSHLMQKGPMQATPQVFHTIGSNDMMMNQMENDLFNEEGLLMFNSQSQSFLKNLENNGIDNIAPTSLSSPHIGDMMTVDFMGVGGVRTRNLHDKQLQQGMDQFDDVINDEKQGLSPFQ